MAVKLMHEHLSSNTSLRKRFLREATILDQVDHRNAVKVYGTGAIDSGEAYFAMELLEGIEVGTVWKRKNSFPIGGALRIISQVLDCLDAYHEAGVLHRDLKPGNLFLTETGIVKLIDFGLARFRVEGQKTTKKGTALGTPAYMAPEQALGKQEQVDRRTDVFGIGATLFALLSGRPLYDIGSADAALVQAATSRPDSLADHAPHLPDSIIELVDTATEWERQDRYQTAAELRDTVKRVLESENLEGETEVTSPDAQADDDRGRPKVGWVGVMRDFFDDITGIIDDLETASRHETSRQDLKNAYNKIRLAAQRRNRPIRWKVLPHSFEMDGEVVWAPEGRLDDAPYQLYAAGVRSIQLDANLRFSEFVTLIQWLTEDTQTDLPAEDDLATRFRDFSLNAVDVEIVDVFQWTGIDSDESAEEDYRDLAERAVDYLHQSQGMWNGLENLVDATAEANQSDATERPASVSNKIDELATEFLRSPKGILSKRGASTLYKSIREQASDWDDRFGGVLADIWGSDLAPARRPEATIEELVAYYINDDRAVELVAVLRDTHARLGDPARQDLVARAFPEAELRGILTACLEAAVPEAD
ncbi:MAG: serine/threonine-protein kinase, partial [Bradymonadaceae bacterium]